MKYSYHELAKMIDHSLLHPTMTDQDLKDGCHLAAKYEAASVCIKPYAVKRAKELLEGSGVYVGCVIGFPHGNSCTESKRYETELACRDGADEIDMVISRSRFLQGDYTYVSDEIAQVKEACGELHLKVILETGELVTLDNVRLASDIAMQAGADFIKTSTGKVSPAASPPVVLTMLEAIRDFETKTGKQIGMKPAGGIGTAKQAIQYLVMVKETLGVDWLSPDLFRFGASSLANDVLMQIIKQNTGRYQSKDYFSID